MPDTAGNSLATATTLNLTSGAQSFPDLVTPTNNDYYRFVLLNRSSLNLTLTGLDADANVELLDGTGNLVSVGGIPQRSTNASNFSEAINTTLDPGTYFIRVSPGASVAQANYILNISGQDNLLSTDLVWRYPGLTGLWTLDGTTFVSAPLLSSDLPPGWNVGGLGDFNRDGKSDIIWRNDSAALTDVWYMDGTTLLSSASIFPTLGADWAIGGTSDFNDDGFIDIVWRNESIARTDVWYMNGVSLLSSATIDATLAGPGWVIGAVGDFNQDGNPDLLWRNRNFPTTDFWFLNGLSIEAVGSLPAPDVNWVVGGTGDLNRDGNLDLIWRYLGPEGYVAGWLLDRTAFSDSFLFPLAVPDPQWVVEAPYTTYGEPAPIDLAGNTIATALDLGKNLAGTATYRDQIGGTTDVDDFYQFNIGTDARVSLSLANFSADLDLGLYDSSGVLIQASTQTGTSPESILRQLTAGTYYIQVQAFDPASLTTYALSINVNTPPVLVSNNVLTLSEQGSATLTNTVLRVTDGDNLPPELIFTLGVVPANGALLVNGVTATTGNTFTQADIDNSQIRYIHNGSETTSDRFTFTVSDNSGGAIDTTTFTFAVTPVNDLPTVVSNLGLTLSEGASANLSTALLQFTDVDSPVNGLVYSLTTSPANGTLLLSGTAVTSFTQADLASGNLSYQHNGSETTSDRFTFTVSDGAGGIVTSSFTIGVTPVNDPPVLATNLGLTVSEGQANNISATLLQITDPDNAPESLVYSVTSLPTNGTLLLSGTAVTSFTQADVISGNLSYLHNGSETTSDRFTFTITDGLIPTPIGLNTFTINVTPVNDPPVVAVNAGLTLSEGTSALITPIRLQATDPEGQTPVIYTLDSLPTNGAVRLGTQTLLAGQTFTQADITNNQVAYIHNDTETTTDSFRFSVADATGAIAPSSTFSITILAVNDAPVLTVPTGTQTIDQETNTLIAGIRVTDVDLGTGEVTVTLTAGNGVLSLGRTTGITFLAGDGTEDETLTFRGAQDVTNFVLQSLIYRSDNNFRGNDTINVTVNDGGNTGLGGPLSAAGSVTLNVAPVNDAPVLTVPGAQTVREDTTTSIAGISIADPDAGTSPVRVSLLVTNGTLSLTSTSGITFRTGDGSADKALVFEGALGDVNRVLGGLSYLGDRDFSGSDTITISVSDSLNGGNGIPLSDTETIALTITPVNDAPVLTVPNAQQVTENTDLRITGINVTDVDATGELTVNLFASSGRLSLNSTTGLIFELGDGTQDDILAFRGSQAAVNDALRTLIYRANTDFNGNDTIAINVSDGGSTGLGGVLGDSDTIAVTVLGVNNAPVITLPTTTPTADSDTPLSITGISIADPDAAGLDLSVTLLSANGSLSLGNTAGLTFTQGDGSQDNRLSFSGSLVAINAALSELTYRSYPGFTNAFDRITISVNDNGNSGIGVNLSDTEVLFVSVGGAVNQVPIAINDSFSVAEEGTLNGSSLLANDNDPDFTVPLTAVLGTGPANAASFTLNGNGSFTYVPNANFSGSDTFTYRAVDALGGSSNPATVVIRVTDANDPPVAVNDSFTTPEDQPITNGAVLTNDTDIDNSIPLSTELVTGPANASSFTFSPNGSFNYTPRADFNGVDRFTYRVVDALGATSNIATVSLTVTPVNDAPIARNDGAYTLPAGGTLSLTAAGVLLNDTDVDTPLANLTASLVTGTTNGTVTLNPNGSFSYRPTGSFTGGDSFTYQVSDGSLTSNLATVTISVGVNSAPVAIADSFTLGEDGTLTVGNVLTNDVDTENNLPLSATIVTPPPNAASFTLNADGTFSYQPRANFSGVDTFVYQASDSLGAISTPATVTFNVTAVNDAPVATNDTLSVSPGATLTVTAPGILANDTDVDSPALSAVLVASTTNGVLSLNPNGFLTYRPNPGFSGTDSFTYRANDGSLSSANTATVSLVVTTAANTIPIATPDSFTLQEDQTLVSLGTLLLANDSDPDNNLPLTVSVLTQPGNGSLSISGSTFNYVPNSNFAGIDSFTYAAIDSLGGVSTPATVTLSVTPVNDAPTVANDAYTVATTASLNITAPGILANDSDVDSPSLTATLVATAANGTLSLSPNGSFTYQPNAGFSGVDSFTYRATDGSLTSSNLGTVNLTVTSVVNNAPSVVNDTYTVATTASLNITAPGVLQNDTDTDSPSITATLVATAPNGTLNLNADGSFTYRPNAGFSGVDSFTYRASDGNSLSPTTATVNITVASVVNSPPTANPDTFTVSEDALFISNSIQRVSTSSTGSEGSGTANLFNAYYRTDISGDGRYVVFSTDAQGLVPGDTGTRLDVFLRDRQTGTTTLISTAAGGVPSGGSSYAPVISANGRYIVYYSNASNIDAQGIPYSGFPSVYLHDRQTGITTRLASDTTGPATIRTASKPSISSDGRYITYTTFENTGTIDIGRVFLYDQQSGLSTQISTGVVSQASDDGRYVAVQENFIGGNSIFLFDRQAGSTVTITDASQTFGLGDLSPDGRYLAFTTYSPNLVPGDTNTSNDVFIFDRQAGQTSRVSVDSNGVQGDDDSFTASISDDGRYVAFHSLATNLVPGDTNNLRDVFVHDRTTGTTRRLSVGGNGQSFESRISSDGRFVSFASDATNLVPGDTNNSRDVFVANVNSSVLTNDIDSDANLPLTATLVTGPANALSFSLNSDGSFVYQPTANFNGVDTFVYRAIDSLGAISSNAATVTVSVTAVNDAPIAANNSYNVAPAGTLNITLPGVLVGDTDPDGDTLTATLVNTPTGAASFTLNPDGSFTYIPQAAFSGTDSFTYRASDGITVSNLATVSIFVTSNLFPTASPDSFTVQEDTSLTIGNVLTNDTDPDGNIPLTASVTTLPSNGTLSLSPTGNINYVPNPNFSGTDSFTYVAIDSLGGTSAPATVTISVTPVNDLPTAVNDTIVVNAGTSTSITAPGVLANDTDPDGNPLTASVLTNAARGTVTLNANGSFVYTPNAGVFGLDSFTYVANDGIGNSAPATVTIDVNGIPVAVNNTYTAAIGSSLSIGQVQGVLANDSDPDGDSLSASVVANPTQGVLTLNSNGSFVYTPNAGASGIDTFTYRATDGFANATATVTVSLRTNSAPVAIGESYRIGTNGTLNVGILNSVLRNDSDPDAGTNLSASLQTTVSRGSLSLNSDGTFTYVPQTGFQGTDSFVYRASDGITVSGPATVTLSVVNNTAPVANNDTFTAFSGIPRNQTPPGVRGNDTDAEGDNLTVFLVTGPTNGSVTLNPDGSFIYTANSTFQGADTFVYRAFDGIASSTATVTMSVTLNNPPTANPDVFGAIAGETLNVTAPGVLANDNDPEGTLFALAGGSTPLNGDLVQFNSNGSFTYVPRAGFTGVDSFTYRASDGASEVLTTVTISVAPNAAPVANPDTYDVNPNNVLVVPRTLGVLANDTDPNVGQALSASVVTNPLQGSLTLNPNGSFTYTPGAGATGNDSFTYRATDGSFNSTATVTIAINTSSAPPTAVNDGGYTVSTNGTLSITAAGVLANDTDPDGDVIRATLATTPGNGTVSLNPDGSFQYRPNTGFQGTDSFTYRAIDGLTISTPATVFVTVGGANAAPVVTLPGSQLIQQNSTLTLSSGLSVADPDAGSSPIQLTLSATNGTLTLGSITGLSFTAGDGTGDATMTFTGTIANINSALTNLQFTPTAGFTGATQIVLTANDQGATGTGGAQTGSGTVSVNVAAGATLVTNINPGSTSSSPTNLLSFGNTVYFSATDPTGGTELWSSDGTGANTRRVADINGGTAGSAPANLVVVGNTLYYTASTPTTERELWRTDLTTGTGATLVGDIRPGIDSSNPQSLTNYANTLFFVATDGTGGARQLWRVNATGNPVKVSNTLSNVSSLAIAGSTLYFTANGGTQLWKMDTPTSAPVLVSNLGTGAAISNLAAVGDRLFFTARDTTAGVELWSSDGTSATTSRVTDLNPGTGDSNPSNLVVLNGALYFFARDNSGSFKLFRSTAAGGVNEVATLPSTGVAPSQLTVVGSRLFFTVDTGTLASPSLQLWSSDGGASASLVRELNAGNDNISALTSFNGALFFVANDGTGFKVFRSDGSSANTVAVSGAFTNPPASLTVAGNRLLFAASDGANGSELWTVG